MSDDPTKDLPRDGKEISGKQEDDRINVLITAVQSLSTDFQTLRADVQTLRAYFQTLSADVQTLSADVNEIKTRLSALETTVNERSFETKPIWERALAEIAATRAELAETRTELRGEMKDGFRKLGAKMDVLNNDLLTVRGDQRLLEKRVEDLESKAS